MALAAGLSTGAAQVLSITEMRDATPTIAKRFREHGAAADVVFFGSQRKLEAAVIPAALFSAFADVFEDLVIAADVRERRAADDGKRYTSAEVDEMLGGGRADRAESLAALKVELGLD